jgi:hypothetical protein
MLSAVYATTFGTCPLATGNRVGSATPLGAPLGAVGSTARQPINPSVAAAQATWKISAARNCFPPTVTIMKKRYF